ncbi:MAG: DEAD/DEAH box helicase [Actinobacteria bacterium]|nr:DEAD/DEAH box helicase [Actinomycetota bacterium]
MIELPSPDSSGGWHLSVLGADPDGNLVPVEVAIVDHPKLVDQLERVERLLPALKRPGAARRGQVILSQDEAWDLMSATGPLLVDIGFDVRVPAMSTKRVTPSLRLSAERTDETVVGARQLANVSWSALFGDAELSAADIARLSAQARPLVQSHGQWVELDKVDLQAAAAALAERANTTQMTGAQMLRQALGLEGTTLAGGTVIEGSSWAGELLDAARSLPTNPTVHPEGFGGTLRSYQAEALAWLGFLHTAELGGCLALDMGLGKTPVILSHLASVPGAGPTLVIAPPAVVANWAAEAARFTPDLQVVVHHGAGRADGDDLGEVVKEADVVITTYGTAVRDIDALADLGWDRIVLDEAQAIKNPASETAQQLRRLHSRTRLALTGTPIENGLGDLWSILDFTNPGLVGPRSTFISQLSHSSESRSNGAERALRALNGILVFRRTKSEPAVAAELPERIDQLDHCSMTPEQIGLYQAVLDAVVARSEGSADERAQRQGHILAAITALKQICDHPAAYTGDDGPLDGRSGKLQRLDEIVDSVFEADERVLVFTHFASWGQRLADHLTERTGQKVSCYHGGLARGTRDAIVKEFQEGTGPGALVLSLKAGGTGLNLTAANHVVLFDRWWNPAVEDQARDRAWRIGQTRTVVSHRLVCPGTVDERVEDVVADKRRVANLVLPRSSSLADLSGEQLQSALGIDRTLLITEDDPDTTDQTMAEATITEETT